MKSDMQLKQEVIDELNWDPSVDAVAIGVEVNDGVVTLSGHLPSLPCKLAAERAAERIAGVKAVAVNLEVRPAGAQSDEAIGAAAHDALRWHVHLPDDAVRVRVEKGWVTLTGRVDWSYQRDLAERVVSHLRGVSGVTDLVLLKDRVAPPDIVQRIEAAMRRHAEREARHIDVAIEHGAVTLTGEVGSLAERKAAVGAAWSAPGVTSVVDHLRVS